jgi:branched-chain amino acid aminotransferase
MEQAPRYPSWVNGHLSKPGQGRVSVEDAGFQLGCAVFETLLLKEGRVPFLDEHLARLWEGAHGVGILGPVPWDPEAALAELITALDPRPEQLVLRLTLTRGVPGEGPSLAVTARDAVPIPSGGVVTVLAPRAKVAADALEGLKSTSRLRNVLAREAAVRQGAWEALLCTEEGDVVEGTVSNLFALLPGGDTPGQNGPRLVTPSLDRGCLGGIVRGRLLAALRGDPGDLPQALVGLEVVEARLDPEDLAQAREILLTNTTGGVIPVREVRELWRAGEGVSPGEDGVTVALATLLAGLEERGARPCGGGPQVS